jgi:hypothetical protein
MTSCQTPAVLQTVCNIWSIQSVSDPADKLPVRTPSCTKIRSIHGTPQVCFSSVTDGRWSLLIIIAQLFQQHHRQDSWTSQDKSVENYINKYFGHRKLRNFLSHQVS